MSGLRRIRVFGVVGLTAATLLGLAGQAAAVSIEPGRVASAANRWRVVASTRTIAVSALFATSRTNAWLLGGGFTLAQPQSDFPAGLHWNGHSWSKVTDFPKAINKTGIACAGASSRNNAWAFAGTTNSGNAAAAAGALRLEGGRWKLVKRFPAGLVTGCLVESSSEIWVFGDAHVAPGVGTWHLHGRTWTQVNNRKYALDGASAVSTSDVWAEGDDFFFNPVVAHWNGRAWVRNTQLTRALPKVPSSAEIFLGGINATGRNNVWFRVFVVRNPAGKPTVTTVVVHWNGRAWRRVRPTDFGYYLPGAVRDGHGGWWAVVIVNPGTPHSYSRVLHAVRGRWFVVPVSIRGCKPGTVFRLAPVPGSTSVLGLQECSVGPPSAVINVILHGPRL